MSLAPSAGTQKELTTTG